MGCLFLDEKTEQYRLECEARHWIKRFGWRTLECDELLKRIAKIRGREAALKLFRAMQEEIAQNRRKKRRN